MYKYNIYIYIYMYKLRHPQVSGHLEGTDILEASGDIWEASGRHLETSEEIWRHLETSGGIWSSGGSWEHLGGIWEASDRHLGGI